MEFQHYCERMITNRVERLEQFAAAYLLETDLNPRDAILVEKRTEDGGEWYFKQKEKL